MGCVGCAELEGAGASCFSDLVTGIVTKVELPTTGGAEDGTGGLWELSTTVVAGWLVTGHTVVVTGIVVVMVVVVPGQFGTSGGQVVMVIQVVV